MSDTTNYNSFHKQERYINKENFDKIDLTTVDDGVEYNIVGDKIHLSDTDLNITGVDGISVNATDDKVEISGKNFVQKITTPFVLYSTDGGGNQVSRNIASYPMANSISQYTNTGILRTNTPVDNLDAVNKKFVEDNFVANATPTTGFTKAYCIDSLGKNITTNLDDYGCGSGYLATYIPAALGSKEPYNTNKGYLLTNIPVQPYQAANKKYVDDSIAAAALGTYTFKTLFGNQNIIGEGNIDLYQHIITVNKTVSVSGVEKQNKVILTVISSKNMKVDSLTDLKTILGDTFEYPCTGHFQSLDSNGTSGIPYSITQTSINYFTPSALGDESVLLTGFTFTDVVTTV